MNHGKPENPKKMEVELAGNMIYLPSGNLT